MKYFKNTSWLFLEKGFRMIIALFIGTWIARYLGTEGYGVYSYVISFVGLFQVFATLGLDNIVIRELVKNESQRDSLLGTAFVLKLCGALVMMVALGISGIFTSNTTQTNILIYIYGSTGIFQSFNVIAFYFQSKVQGKFVVFSSIVSLLVSSMLKLYFIISEAPLGAFVGVFLIESIVLGFCYVFYFYRNGLSIGWWNFNRGMGKSLISESWPLIISGVVVAVYMKIDQVMIKEMLGNDSVGQYGAAVRLSEIWFFIPTVITASLFPAIISSKKANLEVYETRLQKLYDLMVYLALGIAIPIILSSNWIVEMLYGTEYDLTAEILKVHIWSGVFVFLGVASVKWLINENLQKYFMVNTAIGAIVNIILNYFFIKKLGVIGAAWSSLIAYFVASYFCLVFFKRTRSNFYSLSKSLIFLNVFKSVFK